MHSVNHGQSKEKKEYPSDRFEKIVVITEEEGRRRSCEKKDDLHFPAEIVLMEDTPVELETELPIISSERAIMDYVSIKGIKNRTGAAAHELLLYVLKELIDNGLDFIDKYAGKAIDFSAKLYVSVKKKSDKITVRIANSDFGHEGLTRVTVESIFTFTRFFSSKRNQYKVSRGALGDALKEVICVPYALAEANDIPSWNEPLIIESGKNLFVIHLDIDKVNQTISSRTEVKERPETSSHNFTVVEITMPVATNLDLKIQEFLENYSLLNTHVSFKFDLSLDDKGSENVTVDLPACQKPILSSNLSSIHYYALAEFKNFVLGLDDNNTPAYQMLQIFREGSNIKKEAIPETIGELKKNPERMKEQYENLRNTMKTSTKITASFSFRKKEREEALIDRIEQLGYTVSDIKYGSRQSNYITTDVQFPFLVEVAIISVDESPYNLLYVEGTNCSHRAYYTLMSSRPGTFKWRTTNGKIHSAASIFEILEKHGYSFREEKCKRPDSIAYFNLISPRFDYQNYGKTIIDLKPFAEAIADTTYKVCIARGSSGTKASYYVRDTAEGLLTELLESRLEEIENEPSLIHTDRWTQSTVYYRLRPKLITKEIDVQRKYVTNQIRKICEKKLGKTRAELGIVAADRAQLYFRGQWHDVGLDELDVLMHLGTDMLIIEKEGVAEVLSPFADKMGIAILNTRGFLTEYASMLTNLSKVNGCNVAILTDFDVSGLLLARKVPGVYRIGIDFTTLDYFQLKPEDVEEPYKAENNHLKPLSEMGPAEGEDKGIFTKNLKYIANNRIEIDSVLAKVGNKPFWEYIVHKLVKQFPQRNYNRSINVPEFVMPDVINEFLNMIKNMIAGGIEPEYETITDELSDFEGTFDDVSEQEEKITTRLKKIITNDKEIQPILTKVQNLIDEIATRGKE